MIHIKVIKLSQIIKIALIVLLIIAAAVAIYIFARNGGDTAHNLLGNAAIAAFAHSEGATPTGGSNPGEPAGTAHERTTSPQAEQSLSPDQTPQPTPVISIFSDPNAIPVTGGEDSDYADISDTQAGAIEIEVLTKYERLQPEGIPRVLIYHTHTYEAYQQDEDNKYVETEKWRTADNDFNIVRIGSELADILVNQYNIDVVHDTTAFEPPRLGTSYERSLVMLKQRESLGEEYDIYIDIHRDAYYEGAGANAPIINGRKAAQIMLLIGNGITSTGVAYSEMPNWTENVKLAQAITDKLNEIQPNLALPVKVMKGRFNQHISEKAVLIEVGHNQNTLDEALSTVPLLAQGIAQLLLNGEITN